MRPGLRRAPAREETLPLTWSRPLTVLFLALCAAWYAYRCWLLQVPNRGGSDFQYYYDAATLVLHGQSPFSATLLYPPLLSCLLAPLARLDYFTARWIWFVFSHAVFILAGYLLWKAAGRGRLAACIIAFVWAAGGAAEDGFAIGQLDALLVLLIVVASTQSGWLQAATLGFGFGLKVFPAVLGALPLLARKWRQAVLTVAAGALFMGVPWGFVAVALKGPMAPSQGELTGTPWVLNWSLPAVVLRASDPPSHGALPQDWIDWDLSKMHPPARQRLISLGVAAITLLAGLAALYRVTRGRLEPDAYPVAGAAVMALTMAASPIWWWHYPVLEYPGVALLLLCAARLRRPGLFLAALAVGVCLYQLPAAVLRYYYHLHERWPAYPATMYFWTALPAAASLVLFGLLLLRLREPATGHVK